uniref:Uncharacterized protein n=1 Tax=Anguilla anguilla TaxID=7936 RepID=A0A0E9X6X3_ANGAN
MAVCRRARTRELYAVAFTEEQSPGILFNAFFFVRDRNSFCFAVLVLFDFVMLFFFVFFVYCFVCFCCELLFWPETTDELIAITVDCFKAITSILLHNSPRTPMRLT